MDVSYADDGDIGGLDHDWLGSDKGGRVAVFSTGGALLVPSEFRSHVAKHQLAMEMLTKMRPTTEALFWPRVADGYDNMWKGWAERGLFAYDYDFVIEGYRLVAAPRVAQTLNDLPTAIEEVVVMLAAIEKFEDCGVVTRNHIVSQP